MVHPVLYEVNARQWLAALGEKHGRRVDLFSVPDEEVQALKKKGFSHLWLMGVWPTGAESRAQAVHHPDLLRAYDEALPGWSTSDILGSPYAVADYTVADILGGEEGLKVFRAQLAAAGVKLILDFIPNHLGLDHSWLQTHPERFVAQAQPFPDSFPLQRPEGLLHVAHGKDPYFPGWTDTVQLDYRRDDTRAAMRGVLESLTAKCDGVRCDMAMLPLNEVFQQTWRHVPVSAPEASGEFWKEAIGGVKHMCPGFLFLAEAYWGLEGQLCDLGFDYAYDKKLYDILVHDQCWDVQQHLLGMAEHNRRRAHFIENHDEPRIAASLDHARHQAALLLLLGLPGMRFLHDGQFAGFRRFARIQLSRHASEECDPEVYVMYEKVFSAFVQSALVRGEARLLTPERAWSDNPTSGCFSVIQWNESGERHKFDLVVVNHAPHQAQCRVPLWISDTKGATWRLADRLGAEEWVRDSSELSARGLFLDVGPHGCHLFSFTRE